MVSNDATHSELRGKYGGRDGIDRDHEGGWLGTRDRVVSDVHCTVSFGWVVNLNAVGELSLALRSSGTFPS
jgi:hypothetical protein